MKKIQVNVKPEIYAKFKKLCDSRGTNVSVEIRRLMYEEVIKSEKE